MKGRTALVVGGGQVAERKVKTLLEFGARVRVISPELTGSLKKLSRSGRIAWVGRAMRPSDIKNADIVIAATSIASVNGAVSRRAKRAGIPVNVVDRPTLSSFISPAVFRAPKAVIAVYTHGIDPVLSRDLKNFIKDNWNMFLSYRDRLQKNAEEAMRRYFGADAKRIRHAQDVLKHAKEILRSEKGAYDVVVLAAILHDIGIIVCEKKYDSTDGQLQEKEGPPIAEKILADLNVNKNIVSEVCQIIASHHSPGEIDTPNFKIIWDADLLVNLKDEYKGADKEKLKNIIEKKFLTRTGKTIAGRIYIAGEK